ncbi:sigma-54 interaction domain-containing protein [Natranaerobius thermophilus]|uniref:PAS modulated sigma54 specific transcriptional regulator, Fis family n=1 Tax=Natranaerobius thermophilus (strain ATCC BAA-1301 / DSM 18059 / JW/NM-WN-LF) TaxID=457570 RepID=B2A2S4_NATTJ|nr:sigma-54-dependent Fis family transcriptional regulator [Natranaerobius thermophilus]ACB86292.1 PAS modulated sigma54 specific transcriptional regulator, Fis family [Natranaerobius thermophilus JW/NM-WN-LF]
MSTILKNFENVVDVVDRIFDVIPVPVILVDEKGIIRMINRAFADLLKVSKQQAIGRPAVEVDHNSKWPVVLKSGEFDIAKKHKFARTGEDAVVHRIPIYDYDSGEIVGGFGMVLFQNLKELRDLADKNKLLEKKLDHYKQRVRQIYSTKYSWDNIKTCSSKMEACKQNAKKAARTDLNVLITGESGVGKEIFAQAIHNESHRSDHPFIKVNCAAIPENLLESELFGYQGGAFTGASKEGKPGKFELADKGTLFFDEIGDMPKKMQAKLLRVIQEGEVERLGGQKEQEVDVRIIAATNKNLEELVATDDFREDLFYRINVLTLNIPPLKDRKEDIALLAEDFLYETKQEMGENKQISQEAVEVLQKYDWPGNIRQLKNIIQRLAVNAETTVIEKSDIPIKLLKQLQISESPSYPEEGLNEIVEQVEKKVIRETLELYDFNKSMAASILNIPRSTLYRKMKKYGLKEGIYGSD